ncbi:hypothetical protein EYF80_016824 [Liparis tanakae]|uniref:Uncharacterized protein n=1 Tax=Liparis tanakae TaxID=230148 RepID=A0A4Z2I601_9TELE|nr:hypothetical protein EYF80_016824 [Liparis tanakae]
MVVVHGEEECVTLNKPNANPSPRDTPAADLKVRLLTFWAAFDGPLFLLPFGRPLGRLGTGSPLGS